MSPQSRYGWRVPMPKQELKPLKVACFVGNGFDLGLGLDTGYRDFLSKFLANRSSNYPARDWLVDQISRKVEDWGDAEAAFGQLQFSKQGGDVLRLYLDSERAFQEELESFLKYEETRLNITEEKSSEVARELLRYFSGLLDCCLDEPDKKKLAYVMNGSKEVEFNFINFNYTHTLDRLLGLNVKASANGNKQKLNATFEKGGRKYRIGQILHPHGSLGNNAIFGVAHSRQIGDAKLLEYSNNAGYFVKSRMAEGLVPDYDSTERLLSTCDVMILFGVSYGTTDEHWWNMISRIIVVQETMVVVNRYMKSKICVLCPFSFNPQIPVTPSDKLYFRKKEIDRFLKGMGDIDEQVVGEAVRKNCALITYGPYQDPINLKLYYCDPLHLKSFGRRFVNKYFEKDDLCMAKSRNSSVQNAIEASNAIARQRGIGVFDQSMQCMQR